MHWAEYSLTSSWDAKHNILHLIEITGILEKMENKVFIFQMELAD